MAKENDIVLVYFEDAPRTYARIEQITADRQQGWYHVTLLILQVPRQTFTWILRDAYIDGDEFSMNGSKVRLELLEPAKPFQETDSHVQLVDEDHVVDDDGVDDDEVDADEVDADDVDAEDVVTDAVDDDEVGDEGAEDENQDESATTDVDTQKAQASNVISLFDAKKT